jgi:hypothetical protein
VCFTGCRGLADEVPQSTSLKPLSFVFIPLSTRVAMVRRQNCASARNWSELSNRQIGCIEASPWENVGTQNRRRNLFQRLPVERAHAANFVRSVGSADAPSASNAATVIKQEKYSTGLKLGRLFAQAQATATAGCDVGDLQSGDAVGPELMGIGCAETAARRRKSPHSGYMPSLLASPPAAVKRMSARRRWWRLFGRGLQGGEPRLEGSFWQGTARTGVRDRPR